MYKSGIGKKKGIIPDCELPEEGDGILKGHESVIIVNDSDEDAKVAVTLYFTERDCHKEIQWKIGARRVKCFRMNSREDMCGFVIPYDTQYAIKIESSCNIVVQYGRLDNRQVNLAYYTTLGYAE